jgi:hypothetical protein
LYALVFYRDLDRTFVDDRGAEVVVRAPEPKYRTTAHNS